MPYTEAQKRAIQKYRQTEKGKEISKNGRVPISFELRTKSEADIITAIGQLSIPKGQYAKIALKEKLVRDGYLK